LSSRPVLLPGGESCPAEDIDYDDWTVEEGDCDDEDPSVHPLAAEVCDGVDNDCDGEVDEDGDDRDRDGYVKEWCFADVAAVPRGDCNDENASIYPGALDSSNDGLDADCGGTDGPDPHVGLSESSFSTIQAALDAAADGQIVWVGPGTYLEHGLSMNGKVIALRSTHGRDNTTIDGQRLETVFLFIGGETSKSTLDGFTITRGNASYNCREDEACNYWGGGMYLSSSSPTLTDMTFIQNFATLQGGGIYMDSSNAFLNHITFTENNAQDGGGMYLYDSNPNMTDIYLDWNFASETGGGIGMYAADPTINAVTLTSNSAALRGGGMDLYSSHPTISHASLVGNETNYDGGGMYLYHSNPTISLLTLTENLAERNGGGMFVAASNPTMTQLAVGGNYAIYSGGGMFLSASNPTITQSVVAGNFAGYEGGGMYLNNSAPRVQGSIVSYNSGDGFNIYNSSPNRLPSLTYNNAYDPDATKNLSGVELGDTNLTVEPGFLIKPIWDPIKEVWGFEDFHLATDSPLINAGAPDTVDPDGSRADIGIYGGPDADRWDYDGDGYYAYFWPGTAEDVPEGFNSENWDSNDKNPNEQ